MIRFWPRKPRFPVIIDTGIELIGARTAAECSKKLAHVRAAAMQKSATVIDVTARVFNFYPERMVITPAMCKKKWTKAQVIELYNSRRKEGVPEYPSTSLGNKTVKRVVSEIAGLLNQR